MKTLKDIILEKLIINKDIKSKNRLPKEKMPEIGKIAYDFYGEKWEILDYCSMIDNDEELKKFIKKYDKSKMFDNEILNNDFNKGFEDDYNKGDILAVAAKHVKTGSTSVWFWGELGLHYDNK